MQFLKIIGKILCDIGNEMINKGSKRMKTLDESPEDIYEQIEAGSCDLELDTDDAMVHPLDGIFIEHDDEEVRLLCYYFKPGFPHNGPIKCRCVCELRASHSAFLDLAHSIQSTEQKICTWDEKDEREKEGFPIYA